MPDSNSVVISNTTPIIRPLLKELKDSGFRLKDDLIQEAIKLAGEI